MSINFKTIRYKNILAVGNEFIEIKLNKSSTTLVSGTNGAGKSTLIEALFYALYGKPYRSINKPQLINSITQKNLLVELEFSIGKKEYLIRRGMRPNIFEIYLDGVQTNQAADTRDHQEMLEKQILRMNQKSASQITVLGTAIFTPFMQLSPGSRRQVIEDLLDIQVFSTMNSLLRDRINQNKQDASITEREITLTEEKIELIKKHIAELSKNTSDQIVAKKEKIESYEEFIRKAEEHLVKFKETLEAEKEHLLVHKKRLAKLDESLDIEVKLETRKSKISKDIKFFHDNDNCPTCKQEIQDTFKESMVSKKKTQLEETESALEVMASKISKIQKELDKTRNVSEKISDINEKVTMTNSKITSWNSIIADLREDILELEKVSASKQDDDLTTEKQSLRDRKKKLSNLKKHKRTLDIVHGLLKDGGIKTRIIRQYIPVINKLINKYLAMMEFYVTFELNEKFEETIKSKNRDEFTYASFSEGEKSRIDLALLFTWRAIARMRNSSATNLLILDETFDSSLDQSGIDELMKIIETAAVDTNVFVISHGNEGLLYDKFRSHIRFDKIKGFTKIVS